MKRSEDRILTSHTGALHLPTDLQEMIVDEWSGKPHDQARIDARLETAVAEIVGRQAELGVDVVNDGEFSKSSWMGYATERMAGIEFPAASGETDMGAAFAAVSKDQEDFSDFYTEVSDQLMWIEPAAADTFALVARQSEGAVVTGPISYVGQDVLERDIAYLTSAVARADVEEAFMAVVAPSSVQAWIRNEYYSSDEELFQALAAALKEEYRAIVDAGLIVQIDDAYLATEWDRFLAQGKSLSEFRAWAALAVDALNEALDGLPEDRIRYHLCWGSWHGPHSTDVPLRDIVDLVLKVNAQTYSLEAANARHEWEWRVWEDTKLPEGKILMPGVIEHTTHVIEHPETVAERIKRFADVVGRENVIAGTDCGLRFRAHPQIAWAKLKALSDGATLASQQLWGRG